MEIPNWVRKPADLDTLMTYVECHPNAHDTAVAMADMAARSDAEWWGMYFEDIRQSIMRERRSQAATDDAVEPLDFGTVDQSGLNKWMDLGLTARLTGSTEK